LARTAPWQAMVASISLRARCTTVAGVVLGQLGQHAARQLHRIALGQLAGTARTARVRGRQRRDLQPQVASVSAQASAVATSSGVAAKVAGISSGWLASEARCWPPQSSWALSRS
jgi:hypothetical protein